MTASIFILGSFGNLISIIGFVLTFRDYFFGEGKLSHLRKNTIEKIKGDNEILKNNILKKANDTGYLKEYIENDFILYAETLDNIVNNLTQELDGGLDYYRRVDYNKNRLCTISGFWLVLIGMVLQFSSILIAYFKS